MALLSFKWFLPALVSLFHPFFVSVTEVTHNAKAQEYEITSKLFVEDLENVIKQNYQVAVHLTDKAREAQNGKLVAEYMKKHLSVAADGKALPLNFLGFEVEKESVYCYFDVSAAGALAAPRRVDVQNSLLLDLTDKELNIVHVTVNGTRKSTKLDNGNRAVSFAF